MTCCPDGAWKNLHNKEYKPKGEVEHIEATGLNVYKVGKSEKCLIWNFLITDNIKELFLMFIPNVYVSMWRNLP